MAAIDISKNDGVTIVTINRPHARNAVDRDAADRLLAAFEAFDKDEAQRVAVLTGAEGTFCSGADLKAISQGKPNRIAVDGPGPMGPTRMLLSKPVIAAIEGYAVAGGLELALWCDLRVASRNAAFGVFCRRWGVPLIDGGTIRLSRLIGHSHALDMILTGREVGAAEAKSMGLVNRLVEPGTALAEAMKLASQLCRFPQHCMRSDRMSSYQQWDLTLKKAIELETRYGMEVIESGETESGARGFAGGKGRHGSFEK